MLKKSLSLAVVLILSLSFAQYEDVLIDFNVLGGYKDNANEQYKALYNDNWKAQLNSSADFIYNRKYTYCQNAYSKGHITEANGFEGGNGDGNVLGIRCNFPTSDYNAYVKVKPLFDIESYAGDDGKLFVNRGLLKNVSTLKKIIIHVKGKNYPHGLYINLRDENNVTTAYFMGYLDYSGWLDRDWNNPNYLREIRNRRLYVVPEYPRIEPLVKIDSFTVFRDGDSMAKNFICYIGWVKCQYDKAIFETEDDIDDEAIWNIRRDTTDLKANQEKKRLDREQELRLLERKKVGIDDPSSLRYKEERGEAEGSSSAPAGGGTAAPATGAATGQ